MTACGGGGGGGSSSNNSNTITVAKTSGELKITGLSSYNDSYVFALSHAPLNEYVAFYNVSSLNNIANAKISNGTATLKVWKYDGTSLYDFSGNNTIEFRFSITDRASLSITDFDDMTWDSNSDHFNATITFSNGKGLFSK